MVIVRIIVSMINFFIKKSGKSVAIVDTKQHKYWSKYEITDSTIKFYKDILPIKAAEILGGDPNEYRYTKTSGLIK